MSESERDMLELLRLRYLVDSGNGPRFVGAEHVRSHAGFDARRTCDYVAMDLWPSKGLALHGHEVKVSRSDWLRELKDPSKSAEFMRHVDFWWLVAPPGVAQPAEMPEGWGLLVGRPGGVLRVAKSAPSLSELDTRAAWSGPGRLDRGHLSRSFTASLLRAAVKTALRP